MNKCIQNNVFKRHCKGFNMIWLLFIVPLVITLTWRELSLGTSWPLWIITTCWGKLLIGALINFRIFFWLTVKLGYFFWKEPTLPCLNSFFQNLDHILRPVLNKPLGGKLLEWPIKYPRVRKYPLKMMPSTFI